MTDQLPPYSPPPYQPSPYYGYGYGAPQPDLLGPARRSAILMYILGGLILLMGGCLCAIGNSSVLNQLPPPQMEILRKLETEAGISGKAFLTGVAVVMAVPGVIAIVLGIFVRKGGKGSIITSLVLTSLVALWLVLNMVTTLISPGGPEKFGGVCMVAVVLVLIGFLLQSLISALRNAGALRQMQEQYAAQWWHYQQQQQQHQQQQQQMYYGQPPMQPPPPPPQQPPPPPQ